MPGLTDDTFANRFSCGRSSGGYGSISTHHSHGSGAGATYGYGDGNSRGDGCGHGDGLRLRWLDSVDGRDVWFDPVFGVANVGCQVLTIDEWRKRWRSLARRERMAVSPSTVEYLFREAMLLRAEACKT